MLCSFRPNTCREVHFRSGIISVVLLLLGSLVQESVTQITVTVEDWVENREKTVMTCSTSDVIRLQWYRSALNAENSVGATLIYEAVGGSGTPGAGIDASRYEFVASGNFPLTIKSVELDDEGKYWCQVIASTGQQEDSGGLRIQVPVDNTTMYITYNDVNYMDGESININATIQDATFNCTAPGIKPEATVFVWSLNGTTQPSTGPTEHSANKNDPRLTDSTSTAILDIPNKPNSALKLACETTNRQDGSIETEAVISITLNVEDPCKINPCQNGGTCRGDNGEPKCTCPDGYTGATCGGRGSASCLLCRLDVILLCLTLNVVEMVNLIL